MAFRITAAHEAPTVDIEIPIKGSADVLIKLPKLGYIPPEITDEVDRWTTAKFAEISAKRNEANEKRIPIPDSDAEFRYPTYLDVMDQYIQWIEPDVAATVAKLTHAEREQIWKYWNKQSGISEEKSEASSDSSDATE